MTFIPLPTVGRKAAANSLPTVLSNEDKAALDSVATSAARLGNMASVVASVTRPANATPYSVNDVIGTAVTGVLDLASSFRAVGGSGYIVKVKLHTDQAANIAQFRVHLFNVAPTAIADNAPFALLYADEAKYVGFIDIPAVAQEGAGSTAAVGVWAGQLAANADAAGTSIFAVIETKTAFTPNSGQQFALRITVDQN